MDYRAAVLMAFAGCGDFPITSITSGDQHEALTGRSYPLRRPRHNDADAAQRYRDERKARKLRSHLKRTGILSAESAAWLDEYEEKSCKS